MTARVLDRRTLNRTLLDRQHLLERVAMPAESMIEHLVAIQAQNPGDPYVTLWNRIDGFDPASLSDLLEARRVVRVPLLRTTIHLVTSVDCLALRPVFQPVLERGFATGSPFGRRLADADIDAVVDRGRELLDDGSLTIAELRRELADRWPDLDSRALAYAVRYLEPIVQVPPRGLWRRSGQPRWTTVRRWLGRAVADEADPTAAILRYLAAFGPATVADIQAWCWLTRLRDPVERLRPRLRTYRDESGRELFDVPDGRIVEPDRPAPVRFLAQYDNVTLSHDDRDRVVSGDHRRRLRDRPNPWFGTVLVDGFVRAVWRVEPGRGGALRVEPLEPLTPDETADVQAEARALAAFLDPELAERVEVIPVA